MIYVNDKKTCCGCNACGDACPKGAIIFQTDIEGFWYPKVDKEKCIDCGLCEKVCPIINIKELKKNDLPQSTCYAAEHKNMEVIFDSTSGGLFSALADIMYRNNGYVGGAVFNEDFSVRHYISNDKHDLPQLRSSKYLQSNMNGFYNQVKQLLMANEQVLVCGTPCQMTALRSFLRKDYENLIIVDFICRGINSPKVWQKYLDSFEERYGSKVVYCKAKSKEYGWRNLTQKVILANGKHCYETKDQSNFTKGYLQTGVYCRPSCYDCKFKGYPRISDITLADFWGIENVDQSMEKDLGTSLVMINSKKGQNYFEKIKPRINYVPVSFESIEAGNQALKKPLQSPKVDRKKFFEDLQSMTFLNIADKYVAAENKKSLKFQIKQLLKGPFQLCRLAISSPSVLINTLKCNSIRDIVKGLCIMPLPHCVVQFDKGSIINRNGSMTLGCSIFRRSKLETRLLVSRGGILDINGSVAIGYGSDIEVFNGGQLIFEGNNATNIACTIICGEKIQIGKDVMIGRNVTIRDNNGNHFINRAGYKNTRPVIVGDKVWLCEGCTIMPGVKIGDGAIVGAKAFVTSNVPAHSMVSGNPAVVVDEDVLWKY